MANQPYTTYPRNRQHTLPATRMDDVVTINGAEGDITLQGDGTYIKTVTSGSTITVSPESTLVKDINGKSNQVTLVAGNNITITPDPDTDTNTITIASTASGKAAEKTEIVTSGSMTVAAVGAAGLQVGSLIANQGTDGTKECHISLNPNINNTGAIYISTDATRPATLLNPLYPDQLPTYVFNGANSAYLYADSAGDSVDLVLEYWV